MPALDLLISGQQVASQRKVYPYLAWKAQRLLRQYEAFQGYEKLQMHNLLEKISKHAPVTGRAAGRAVQVHVDAVALFSKVRELSCKCPLDKQHNRIVIAETGKPVPHSNVGSVGGAARSSLL